MKKIIISILVIAIIGGLIYLNLKKDKSNLPFSLSAKPPVKVKVEKVKKGKLEAQISASGEIAAVKKVDISSQITAQIQKINVKEGDEVKEGDILVVLESTRYKSNLDAAEARLKMAQAAIISAKATLEESINKLKRNEKLFEEGFIPRLELEASQTLVKINEANYENALQQLDQAKAAVNSAKDEMEKTVIRSPINGIVTNIYAEEGENVITGTMNNPGTVIMRIANMNEMAVDAEIDETDVIHLKENMPCTINAEALPNKKFNGRIVEIAKVASKSRTTFREDVPTFHIKVIIENPSTELKPGMSANVEVITKSLEDAIKVPIQAVVRRSPSEEKLKKEEKKEEAKNEEGENLIEKSEENTEEVVFVVEKDRAIKKKVTTGLSSDQEIEIVSGLKEGEIVIVGPYRSLKQLKDGDKVKIED